MRNLKLKLDHLSLNHHQNKVTNPNGRDDDDDDDIMNFFPRRIENVDDNNGKDVKRHDIHHEFNPRNNNINPNGHTKSKNNSSKGKRTFDLASWIQQGSICTASGSKLGDTFSSQDGSNQRGIDRNPFEFENEVRNVSISSNTYSTEENSSLNDSFDSIHDTSYESGGSGVSAGTLSMEDFKYDGHYHHGGFENDWLPSSLGSSIQVGHHQQQHPHHQYSSSEDSSQSVDYSSLNAAIGSYTHHNRNHPPPRQPQNHSARQASERSERTFHRSSYTNRIHRFRNGANHPTNNERRVNLNAISKPTRFPSTTTSTTTTNQTGYTSNRSSFEPSSAWIDIDNQFNTYTQTNTKPKSKNTHMPSKPNNTQTTMPRTTRPKKREWKSAIDPKSGKRYYYDVHTRQTQWQKPLELASSAERRLIQEKEMKQRRFFQAMEKNILKSMQSGKLPGEKEEEDRVESLPKGKKKMVAKGTVRPKLFRTISSMDDDLLHELTNVNVDNAASSSPKSNEMASSVATPSPTTSTSFFDSLPQPGYGPSISTVPSLSHVSTSSSSSFDNEEPSSPLSTPKLVKALPKPNLSKRNTCGTMYVVGTMADPDKDAAIKCVCGVYRTHIIQSIKEERDHPSQRTKFAEYEIFNDIDTSSSTHYTPPSKPKNASIVENDFGIELQFEEDHHHHLPIPSLDEITDYFRYIFNKAQLENDCIIMSLIYVERLLRETNGGVRPRLKNWKSLLFSCMIMASKVWDDLSMWNVDFSQACPSNVSFSLQRINELELAILSCLNYSVKVPASAYAKYYFLMRSMLIRSGLAGDEFRASKPLDREGAKKLEFLTSEYKAKPVTMSSMRRSKSLGGEEGVKSPMAPKQVKLEQVVHM